jgi:hypothetical protein
MVSMLLMLPVLTTLSFVPAPFTSSLPNGPDLLDVDPMNATELTLLSGSLASFALALASLASISGYFLNPYRTHPPSKQT